MKSAQEQQAKTTKKVFGGNLVFIHEATAVGLLSRHAFVSFEIGK